MAQKNLKAIKDKVASKKVAVEETGIVLVGTYGAAQMKKWILPKGYYNYPVGKDDDCTPEHCKRIKELWLYKGKSARKVFAAEFIGVKTRAELPDYPATKTKPHGEKYLLFKVKELYGPQLENATVHVRVSDFTRRTPKIAKAVKALQEGSKAKPETAKHLQALGAAGILAEVLPNEIAQVPPERLCVREAAVQLDFFDSLAMAMPMKEFSIEDVAKMEETSIKNIRRFVASGQLKSVRRGARYFITESALNAFKIETGRDKISLAGKTDVHFVVGQGIDPEQRDVSRRGKQVGKGQSRRVHKFSVAVDRKTDEVNWQDVSGVWDRPGKSDEMTFVDLFCGAGGLSKGLEMAGLEGICGLDWFDEAGMTYARNFGHPFINGDIKLQNNKDRFYATVAERLNGRQLSVVAGGFPCQGFSMAGNRIVDDPRNSLYKELIEIVEHLNPEFVLCENVKGLRSMLHGAVEKKILDDFRSIGYAMNVTTLCAADYFTPQKRERVIFIGNRIGVKNLHPRPILSPELYRTTRDAIADLMSHPMDPAFNHVPTHHSAAMVARMRVLPEGQSLYDGYSDAWKRCPWNQASCTIKENHGGVNVHPRLPRVLTAREMARIQSFPDDFIFEGKKSKQLVQIGNAVPPFLGKAIGLAIRFAKNDIHQ